MLQVAWDINTGWNAPSIDPLAPLQLHPAAQVLHYGIECFEGMKAYMGADGRIRMFRPDKNMDRLARSAQRLNLPDFDKAEFLECMKELLRVDQDWLPHKEGFSLYLRPTFIATTPHLGIAPPASALLYTVISPVGPYFPTGVKPIKLFVDTKHARAWPGGVGDCKVGGNYASTIRPQVQAARLGCQQVLYVLDNGPDEGDGIVGESGAMNVFFLWQRKDGKKELVTPPLDGMVLPGVTRDTVLSLVRNWSEFEVSERPIHWREIEETIAENRMLEMFGTGTAVIIQPITTLLKSDGSALTVPFDSAETSRWIDRKPGTTYGVEEPTTSLAGRLMRTIMDIQYGHTDSKWSVPIS
jgi:branched-chain amino acid aminotransferase group II